MIEECKGFSINNLLRFRASITQAEMQKELKELEKFIKDNNITIVGPKISTTYSISQGASAKMDLELLIPIDKEFKETDKYKFKPKFMIVNALKSIHKGNPQGFNNTAMEMKKYLKIKSSCQSLHSTQ